jgi:hypothetical protein
MGAAALWAEEPWAGPKAGDGGADRGEGGAKEGEAGV